MIERLIIILFVSLWPKLGITESTRAQTFNLPDGTLVISTPESWVGKIKRAKGDGPYAIFFKSASPHFEVSVVPLVADARDKLLDQDALKKGVEKSGQALLSRAVQTSLEVKNLGLSSDRAGYYFSLTDREPKPGEFRDMTQGMMLRPDTVVRFTILTNKESNFITNLALEAVKSLEFKAVPIPDHTQPIERITVKEENGTYHIGLIPSEVVLSLPSKGWSTSYDDSNSPSYFNLRNDTEVVMLSGWFEPERRYRGIKELWWNEMAAWERKGDPAPTDVTFKHVGEWEIVFYRYSLLSSRNFHMRAELVKFGTWIDLHLSTTSDGPAEDAEHKLISVLQSITVERRG